MYTRREILKLMGAAGITTVVASCSPRSAALSPTSAPQPSGSRGLTQLKVWVHWGGAQGETFQTLVDTYNETQGAEDEIEVVVETVGFGEYRQKMTAARLAGTSPDVYHTGLNIPELAINSMIAPLSSGEQDYVRSNYVEAAVNRMTYQGEIWGYPTEHQAPALAYRRSFLDQAGITEVPDTTDEIRRLAMELTREEGGQKYYGYTFWHDNFLANFSMVDLAWRNGQAMWEFDGDIPKNVMVNTPGAIAGVEWWQNMIKDGSTHVGEVPYLDAWQNGLAIMGEIQAFIPLTLLRDGGQPEIYEDLGITHIRSAQGVGPVAPAIGWHLAMDRETAHPEEAEKFMQWMMHKPDMPFSKFIVEEIGSPPAVKDYPLPIPGWTEEMIKGFVEETVPIMKPDPGLKVLGIGEISAALRETFDTVTLQLADVESTLAEVQPRLDEILQRTDGSRIV